MNLMMSVAPQGGNFRVDNFYNKTRKRWSGRWHEMQQAFFSPEAITLNISLEIPSKLCSPWDLLHSL
jgi:hypothetical protein